MSLRCYLITKYFWVLVGLILTGLQFETFLMYLDDVILLESFLKELEHLDEVVVCFKYSGLDLKLNKCVLF